MDTSYTTGTSHDCRLRDARGMQPLREVNTHWLDGLFGGVTVDNIQHCQNARSMLSGPQRFSDEEPTQGSRYMIKYVLRVIHTTSRVLRMDTSTCRAVPGREKVNSALFSGGPIFRVTAATASFLFDSSLSFCSSACLNNDHSSK